MDEIKEWAEIVIDKSNRKAVYSTIREKENYLESLRQKNNQLEIYLKELDQEQVFLDRANKENSQQAKTTGSKTKRTHAKNCVNIKKERT